MADGDGGGKIVLNKEWMKKFIDTTLEEFQTAIDKISKDGPSERFASDMHGVDVQSVLSFGEPRDNIHSENHTPLALGALAGPEGLAGGLVKAVMGAAKELGTVITDQKKLFDDIEDNLRETMKTLLTTEGESLDKIDGDKFMTAFEDVVDDIADSLAGGGGDGGSGDGGGGKH
ncbi:type VII secretion system-associated protein [Streptomyces lydicus]